MKEKKFAFALIALLLLSGCLGKDDISYNSGGDNHATRTPELNVPTPNLSVPVETEVNNLLIDEISSDLKSYKDRDWSDLYHLNELDCSRMSTYFWDYIRKKYRVAPKIIVSYERQHAWLALRVKDTGNSSRFKQWNIKGVDYYFLEATVPKIVADDRTVFVINGRKYTSSEFYYATIYIFDTPQDANDFHADYTYWGGWNQEFRLRSDDIAKINKLLI